MEERFVVSDRLKKAAYILIGVGLLSLILGFVTNANRAWTSLLLNNLFILGIAICAVFFIAAMYLANSGWHVVIKRIPEAMSTFLPVSFVVMLIIGLGVLFHWHHIYHWSDPELTNPGSEHFDAIIAGKSPYLNAPMFIARMVAYFGLWILLAYFLRRMSHQEDLAPDTKYYKKSLIYSALFIVIFAVSSSTASWDWIMSIDTHWYSTLFGWYLFSSMFVTCMAAIALVVISLKNNGYLSQVNMSHIHDLGKYVFAFSIFWTYLWFCQFMLIWYANIPEETIYFFERFKHYKFWFFAVPFLNFVLPFLILMTRNAKRELGTLAFITVVVLLGHWLDFYLMIYPGVAGEEHTWYPGWIEFGILAGFIGAFIIVVFNSLSKTNLVPKNHPYLEESLHHQT